MWFCMSLFWYFLLALELTAVMAIYLVVTWRQRPQDFGPMALTIAAGELALIDELAVQAGLVEMPSFSILVIVLPLLLGAVGTRLFLMFARALHATESDRNRLAAELKALTAEFDHRVEHMADYDVTGQIVANGRLSYTRQSNSGGGDTDLSGWTGALGLSWQATSKISLRVDAARDAGFNSTSYTTFAFTQTATGIAFTPIVGVFQNNTITTSAGISAAYAATAKISTFASARYYRAHQLNLVFASGAPAEDVIDISNTYSLGANYQITRNWGAACTLAYETRDVSGARNYTYDAKTIGCSTQFTWY